MQANGIIYITIQHLRYRVVEPYFHIFLHFCIKSHSAESALSDLQPRKESLKGVNPGVHDLTTEHVHINIERWVTLSFIAGLSPEKKQADRFKICHTNPCISKQQMQQKQPQSKHIILLNSPAKLE